MLYLFGRLALSDSYYFDEGFHADEFPENYKLDAPLPAPAAPLPAGPIGAGGRAAHALGATKKPATESSNGLF